MTAERNTYTGNATQTPNPAKPRPAARLDLDAIRDRANAATTGPWGAESQSDGLMVLNRGACLPVAYIGSADDDQGWADAEFITAAREDIPALLDEIAALDQVAEDAVALTEQIGAELRAARTEVDRLQRLLDTRDAEYALVVRVDAEGLSQIDGSPGLTLGQAAEWLQELATDTARRANTVPAEAVPLPDVLALIDAVRSSIDMPANTPPEQVNDRVWHTVGALSGVTTAEMVTAAHQALSAENRAVSEGAAAEPDLPKLCPVTAYNESVFIRMVCHHPAGHDGPHHNPASGGWEWDNDGNNVTALDGRPAT